ncbi:hypothetical protein, partial [Moorena sp. SIO1F2]|uniref:hypothetical protein n=1 Tax=Moorena sp. SIO1F2 TaxID=2607819 RepID=UPI0025D48DEE
RIKPIIALPRSWKTYRFVENSGSVASLAQQRAAMPSHHSISFILIRTFLVPIPFIVTTTDN